jgi:hypothetical protein
LPRALDAVTSPRDGRVTGYLCDRHYSDIDAEYPFHPDGTRAVQPAGPIKYLLSGVLVCSAVARWS